jgi:pimeloyl-ACP methyl ester carboxylesterase
MTIETRLCTFKTADNERLHGLLFTPLQSRADLALIFIHGVAMNFYLPPLVLFAQELAERGRNCFAINTRGHDWISRAGNLNRLGGSTYEEIEDCVADLDAAIDFLQDSGYTRFVFVGHSLGAIKSIYYQSTRQRGEVAGIVSCSAPRQFYAERAERQPGFLQMIERAESMIAAGNGDDLLTVSVGEALGPFSARTLLNKYNRDNRNDLRPQAARITCPLLALVGGGEPEFFHRYSQEIAEAVPSGGSYKRIDGANHFYNGYTSQVADVIDEWLEQFR